MARRRYISTDISTDEKVNSISTFAALLYTWAIPHFNDDCHLTAKNAAEVKWTVLPGRKEGVKEVEKAIQELLNNTLWCKDENGRFLIPSDSFYKYQTYINTVNRRETARIAVSLSAVKEKVEEEEKVKEKKREGESEGEGEEKLTGRKLIALWNEKTPASCPAVEKISPARLEKANQYVKAFPEMEFWLEVFQEYHRSKFLACLLPSTNGHKGFRASFDWLLSKGKADQIENCVKVFEGKYRDG